jgi:hypothetical protein
MLAPSGAAWLPHLGRTQRKPELRPQTRPALERTVSMVSSAHKERTQSVCPLRTLAHILGGWRGFEFVLQWSIPQRFFVLRTPTFPFFAETRNDLGLLRCRLLALACHN